MIHATLDDVGTCGNDGMAAVVGYVAYKANWDLFNSIWKPRREALGLDYLHTSEFLRKYAWFGKVEPTDDDIYKCLKPFIDTVHMSLTQPERGFGVCVVTMCDAYNALSREEKKVVPEPELNSFELAIGLSALQVKNELTEENTLAVQMDESQNAPALLKRYTLLKAENDTLKRFLGAICFADDKLHQPVQASDMLGYLTLRAWRNYLAGKEWPTAFRNLVAPEGRRNVASVVYDEKKLKGLAQMRLDLKDRMAMPEE